VFIVDKPTSRWADVEDQKDLQKKSKRKRKDRNQKARKRGERDLERAGRELWIGNLDFSDIFRLDFKTAQKFKLQEQRRRCIVSAWKRYGEVKQVRCSWPKRFIVVEFCACSSARVAFEELQSEGGRKLLCMQLQEEMQFKGEGRQSAPLSSFYVRWTRNTRLLLPDATGKEEEEEPEVEETQRIPRG